MSGGVRSTRPRVPGANLLETSHVSPPLLEELARHHLQGAPFGGGDRVSPNVSAVQQGWEARGLMMLGTIRAALKDVPGAAGSFRRAMALDPS